VELIEYLPVLYVIGRPLRCRDPASAPLPGNLVVAHKSYLIVYQHSDAVRIRFKVVRIGRLSEFISDAEIGILEGTISRQGQRTSEVLAQSELGAELLV
jgi:hypothetical protein